jgi:hypothetical protein
MEAISREASASGKSFARREDFDFVFFRGCPILAGFGLRKGGSFFFLLSFRAKIAVLLLKISP